MTIKKSLSIIIIFAFVLASLFSCTSNKAFNYNASELTENTLKVELVSVERDSYCGEMIIENIQSLSTDKYEAFFEKLSKLSYERKFMIHPENVTGVVILLGFDGDDNFDLIGTQGIENYRANKDMTYLNHRCDVDEYKDLVAEFFEYEWD